MPSREILTRAQGCLLGQFAGDALGSIVEFMTPLEIERKYPDKVRDLIASTVWGTIPGQLTDDSELAIMLAASLLKDGKYDYTNVGRFYMSWLHTGPFDCGTTIYRGLKGGADPTSQSNGALMRISPLGIFGTFSTIDKVMAWAKEDASMTHPHIVCQQVNALFVGGIMGAIGDGWSSLSLYAKIKGLAEKMSAEPAIMDVIEKAYDAPPENYIRNQGWVLIAFHNALYQLVHARDPEMALIDTVMRGGDTDTNAAICGALLGAVYGRQSIPQRWIEVLLKCRPAAGETGVKVPRHEVFWPTNVLDIAKKLLFNEKT